MDDDAGRTLSTNELLEKISELESVWKTPGTPEAFTNVLDIFGITCTEDMTPEKIEAKFSEAFKAYNNIRMGFNEVEENSDDDGVAEEDVDSLDLRFKRFQDCLYYAREVMMSFLRMTNCADAFPPPRGIEFIFWMSPLDVNDLKPPQVYILFLLGSMYRARYRRLDTSVYEQIFLNGHATRAWKERCSIEDQVRRFSSKEQNFEMWKIMTERFESSVRYLTGCSDDEFPDLVSNRRVWSFEDGIYNASDDTFCFYAQHSDDTVVASKLIRMAFSSVYFHGQPVPSAPRLTYEQIHTPLFDSIFSPQQWGAEMVRWMFVFIGRLFYEVGELDGWQVIPFLKGVAGTGKSTVIKVVQAMYPTQAVGVLSNNVEKKFGLSALVAKKIFIVPEVKADCQLDQAEFQSIVTGEELSLAVKHEKPWCGRWIIPGILAGNENIGFVDKSGSISRRLVILDFPNRLAPSEMDPTLLKRLLSSELPAIIRKAAIAYNKAVADFGGRDIWTVLPSRICDERKKLQFSTNPLYSFINSDKVELSQEGYVLERVFIEQLKTFASLKFASAHIAWNEDFYGLLFGDYHLSVENCVKNWPPTTSNPQRNTYITGCKLSMD